MKGKICVVTGSNSGIGKEIAAGLARLGATVVMVCRNPQLGSVARNEIISRTKNNSVFLKIVDLSSLKSVRTFVAEFKNQNEHLDVLVNNAAIWPKKRMVTEDGLELQFMVNYLSHYLLTNLLLDLIKTSAPSRIINVSSGMHSRAKIDFNNLQAELKYRSMAVYGQSKLANVLFTYELARRLKGIDVTVNSFTPGLTATNLGRYMSRFSRFFLKHFAKSPEEGSLTAIYLASSPEVQAVTGKYFSRCKEIESSNLSYDELLAKRLWVVSEKLAGL